MSGDNIQVWISSLLACKLAGKYDARALMLRHDETHRAKLCIEKCANGGIAIVSVVTKQWSDDSNNELLESEGCYRKGNIIAFHYSMNGRLWRFVRKFAAE